MTIEFTCADCGAFVRHIFVEGSRWPELHQHYRQVAREHHAAECPGPRARLYAQALAHDVRSVR